jgi:predicted transcriptional regulator
MPKTPPNHGKPWTSEDDRKLDMLIQQNTPTGLIAYELGRTEDAVRSHASDTDRSLKPVNQSPYNRQKQG